MRDGTCGDREWTQLPLCQLPRLQALPRAWFSILILDSAESYLQGKAIALTV